MAKKCFGGNKISYVIVARGERIEVFVFHENKDYRKVIQNRRNHPQYFLDHSNLNSKIMANKHMAEVVDEYRDKFRKGLVDFTFVKFKTS